jgi:renalase
MMRVAVIGAGLTGLVAARNLRAADVDVKVLDKGRSPGGRLATRRIAGARLDHGAQFFTVRTPAFRSCVDDWIARRLVRVWANGFGEDDGHPRYVAVDGMTALAKDLAAELDVECSTMAFAVRPNSVPHAPRWEVVIDDGSTRPADAVIVTCPLPQTFALLVDSGLDLEDGPFRTDYDRTIGLLVVLDRPGAVPPPGGLQHPDETFGFIADNLAKGVSAVPALTFHATPVWSDAHWDDDHNTLVDALEAAAKPWIGDGIVVERQLKKWRFATPRTIWPDPCWRGADDTIVIAGDAFGGPRVEGAHNSGLAAAHALLG